MFAYLFWIPYVIILDNFNKEKFWVTYSYHYDYTPKDNITVSKLYQNNLVVCTECLCHKRVVTYNIFNVIFEVKFKLNNTYADYIFSLDLAQTKLIQKIKQQWKRKTKIKC